MLATADSDLAQDLATDCSVVASLCAANRLLAPGPGSVSHQQSQASQHELTLHHTYPLPRSCSPLSSIRTITRLGGHSCLPTASTCSA